MFEVNIRADVHYHGDVALKEIRCQLEKLEKIMSTVNEAIKDFADQMAVHNNKVDAAHEGIKGDIKSLGDQIAALQNTTLSVESQAILDGLLAKQKELADKFGALDELTPPIVPAG